MEIEASINDDNMVLAVNMFTVHKVNQQHAPADSENIHQDAGKTFVKMLLLDCVLVVLVEKPISLIIVEQSVLFFRKRLLYLQCKTIKLLLASEIALLPMASETLNST